MFIKSFRYATHLPLLLCLTMGCGAEPSLNLRSQDVRDSGNANPSLPLPPEGENPNTPVITDPLEHGLATIDVNKMREELSFITKDEYNGRLSGTPGNVQVVDYIINHLKELGVQSAQTGNYRQTFTIKNGPTKGKETSNIVALFPGNDPVLKNEYVVIGAHVDHAGTLDLGYTCSSGGGGDKICNGADDNGSGTISVLNITKALASVRTHLKRSVVVMWFSGEELGLEGSWHYVRNPIFPLEKTVYMINLDMVGYMKSYGNKIAALGSGTSDRGEAILKVIQDRYPNREIEFSERAGGGSDHVPFMQEGIPGVFFHTGVSNNPNYHRTSDAPEKIDYEGMHIAAKMAFEQVFTVANDADISSTKFTLLGKREPLITPEEAKQSCHHLILNPYVDKITKFMDNGIRP